MRQIDEGEPELDASLVDSYLANLRTAVNNNAQVSEADVKAMFGEEAKREEPDSSPDDSQQISQLLAAPEDSSMPPNVDVDALVSGNC